MKKQIYILLAAAAVLTASCGDTLSEINKNPNATENP